MNTRKELTAYIASLTGEDKEKGERYVKANEELIEQYEDKIFSISAIFESDRTPSEVEKLEKAINRLNELCSWKVGYRMDRVEKTVRIGYHKTQSTIYIHQGALVSMEKWTTEKHELVKTTLAGIGIIYDTGLDWFTPSKSCNKDLTVPHWTCKGEAVTWNIPKVTLPEVTTPEVTTTEVTT